MSRGLSLARVIALLVIAVLALGLAYLRFAPGKKAVSVPAGAQAGQLTLESCSYATESGNYDADCGTLVVPENRANPGSRLIALPVTRIRATSADPAEPVFRLGGGPGISNLGFPQASRLAEEHDVVLVGYRGIDGSSVLDCPEVVSALKASADILGEASLHAYSDALSACGNRLRDAGVDLAGYTLPERIDDLEAVRVALGYDVVNLLSESVGTRIAMIYSWRYPDSIHRSVMIGVNPPGHFLWDPETTDQQIQHYAELCSQDPTCRARTSDLAASMRATAANMPKRWWFLPIKAGNVLTASFFGLMETASVASPLSAPQTLDSWLAAADGDPSGFWFLSLLSDFTFPGSFVWGETAATSGLDAQAAAEYFSSGGDPGSILGNPGTEFLWGGGGMVNAWPANPSDDQYSAMQVSNVETLLIGGSLDFATPPSAATDELLPALPNGHQVVLAEFGHTTDFWTYQPEASTRLVSAFLDAGEVDQSLYTHRPMNFGTEVTHSALAKGFIFTMVALAILMLLSLVWMPLRVRRRGRFGRKVSVALRAFYPVVLGLGGWFFGALIVLATLPTVPLDNALLGILSIGLPIGLGIYWAWLRRDSSTNIKIMGFAVAMAGALVGAWFGFTSTAGLLALITTIVGATIGTNLVLVALDISRERSVADLRPAGNR